jgi:hypothetical protein
MKGRLALRRALRSVVPPRAKDLAELLIWGLLALVALALVMLPGDQTSAGINWLLKSLEPGR